MKMFYLSLALLTLSLHHLYAQLESSTLDLKNYSLVKKNFNQIDSSGLSKFPLNVGNKWLYRVHYHVTGGIYSYTYHTRAVNFSTVINDKTYYTINLLTGSGVYRYSSDDNKLYRYDNGTDQLIMDFNKTAGDTFQQYINPNTYWPVTVIEGVESHFNDSLSYKGYLYERPDGGHTNINIEHYFDYIGPLYYSSLSTLFNQDFKGSAINVLLYDSSGNAIYYSYGLKPSFENLNPILTISNSDFSISFRVNHPYNVYPYLPWVKFNFISSVKFESFYQRDTIIFMQNDIVLSDSNWPIYNITTNLDTNLMKQGYSFNYRFLATDKQIIPEQRYSPDSGYYKCYWQTVSVEENNLGNIKDYELYQNYPNPFNPSTTIGFSIKETEFVTLKIFDLLGNEIKTLVNEIRTPGLHYVVWDGDNNYGEKISSGIYFYRIQTERFSQSKKLLLQK